MKRTRSSGMRGAWAWLAWLAALMLLAQPALAAAMSAPLAGETITVQLCSAHSSGKLEQVQIPGAPAEKSDCEKCPHCLSAPMAAQPGPVLAAAAGATYEPAAFMATASGMPLGARAPPRPPGQGPPAANA